MPREKALLNEAFIKNELLPGPMELRMRQMIYNTMPELIHING